MLHIDSWEMGAQNWTAKFREEFQRRRGYDPLRYLPVMTGRVVESLEISERFLWDLRQTAQELVIENHAQHLKTLAHRHGFGLSIEPYDMNPCADLSLGGVADVPMCEFWAQGYGFNTAFSCIEAVSIAHTLGRPIVAAESFTSDSKEAWRLHPGIMKPQADWAFCMGINRLVVPSLCPPAVAGPPAGHDHGALRRPLRAHADVVGHGRRLAPVPRPLPDHAAARRARGGHLLPGAGGRPARLSPPCLGFAGTGRRSPTAKATISTAVPPRRSWRERRWTRDSWCCPAA